MNFCICKNLINVCYKFFYNKKNYFSFVKNYPCKIVSKLLQDLLNIKEILNRTENEKLKIQEKIDSLAYEYKKLERDESTSKNEDLLKVIKSEKENLKILLSEYNDKISNMMCLK